MWFSRVEGRTSGGMDVTEAINLFFKGILLFPIFLLAGYIGVTMMKHMIFHGIPVMNTVSPEQRELLREKDSQIGVPQVEEKVSHDPLEGPPGVITDHEWELIELRYQRDYARYHELKVRWHNAPKDLRYDEEGNSLFPSEPHRSDYMEDYK